MNQSYQYAKSHYDKIGFSVDTDLAVIIANKAKELGISTSSMLVAAFEDVYGVDLSSQQEITWERNSKYAQLTGQKGVENPREKTVGVQIRLTETERDKLNSIAKISGVSVNKLITDILKDRFNLR